MEQSNNVERTELWAKILNVISQLPLNLESTESEDAMDLPSAATELEIILSHEAKGLGDISVTAQHARIELDILNQVVPDSVLLDFEDEIISLVNKFGNSGQSGGSAPFVANAISKAVKKLCMHEVIAPITGEDDEWKEHDDGFFQNVRLSSIFKESADARPYYLDAIIFKGDNGNGFSSNKVDLADGSYIGSRHYIKLPFQPKTFYVDVEETEWFKDEKTGELTEQVGGGCWTSKVKDESQLTEAFEYYDRYINDK